MKNIAKQILIIAMMILGATGAWAQTAPTKQSNGTWKFTMPAGNRTLRTTWKQEIGLAWKLGGQDVPQGGVTGYLGFNSVAVFPNLDIPSVITGQFTTYGHYGSSNPAVATIDEATGDVSFVGVGTTTIYAVYNDDDYYDSVYYTLTVGNPYTLTLKSNPSSGNAGHLELDSVDHALPSGVVASSDTGYKYIVCSGTTVTVNAIPEAHYHLASWNNTSGNALQQVVTMTADMEITGVFAIDTFTLTLKTNDIAMGKAEVTNHSGNPAIVSHDPDANGTRTYKVNHGAEVIIKATANVENHYHLESWSNGATVNTDDTIHVIVTTDSTITANFAIDQFAITATANPTSGGTVTGAGTYSHGAPVTLTATANEQSSFVNWTKDGAVITTDETYSFTATEAGSYVANFELNGHEIAASVANTADVRGTVQIAYTDNYGESQTTPAGTSALAIAKEGTTSTLTATPAAGYHFVKWMNANGDSLSNLTTLEVISTVNTALTAVFDTTHAELAWSAEEFSGYTRIDFNTWKPTLTNPHSVNVRYGCAEGTDFQNGGIEVDATTGVIGFDAPQFGHIAMYHGTYHIYAVHETDQNYYYDSVVYTLHVLPSALVGVSKNIPEGGSTFMPDATAEHSLKHFYAANAINGTDPPYVYMALDDSVRILAEPAVGYHFSHWKIPGKSNFVTTLAYTCHFIVPNSEEIDVIPLTVRAFFAPDTFTITYMDGDVELNVDTFYYLQPITDYTVSKVGWDFLGWSPEVPEVMPAENLTMYAQWYRICDSVTDVDHNTYPSVNINNKCWMAANLRTTHYADGRDITNLYEYTSFLYPSTAENVSIYGRLYDWYDAMDATRPTKAAQVQGICPAGWRMPTQEDFAALDTTDLQNLRSTNFWVVNDGNNSTGFDMRGSGMYNIDNARYEELLCKAYFWTANGTSATEAHCREASYFCNTFLDLIRNKENAFSVRCVKD